MTKWEDDQPNEWVEFPTFITKGMEIEKGDRRIFKGHITAEIIDRQNEFIFVKEVMDIMERFMSVNPVISDFHSNRMVGKVLSYEKSEYQGVPTVLITAEVYKKDGITLYDKVWDKVVKGEYSGLSMGGASKEREPIMKDGRMALELRKLELYEIALCATPANPFAIIEAVNIFAKANDLDDDMIKESGGRQYIQCTTLACRFGKGTNIDHDVDVDNHQYKCDGGDVCDICGLGKAEHKLEQFDKDPVEKGVGDAKSLVGRSAETRSESVGESTGSPKEVNDMINQISRGAVKKDISTSTTAELTSEEQKKVMDGRIKNQTIEKDHIPSTTENVEELARKKIAGEQAGHRTMDADMHDESRNPAEHGKSDSIQDRMQNRSIEHNNLEKVQIEEGKLGEVNGKPVEKIAPIIARVAGAVAESVASSGGDDEVEKDGETVPEDKPKTWREGVNSYLKHFGVETVRRALEDYDTLEYLKTLQKKYK